MVKERNLYIDVLKAVTILLVVIGHCIQYGAGRDFLIYGGFFYNEAYIFIYSFHMPLFMLISGYLFFQSSKTKDCKSLLFAKVKQLIVPLFSWSFITLIVEIIKIIAGVSHHQFSFVWIFQTVLASFWGGPWFLWALWWSSLLVIIGKAILKDNVFFYISVCALMLFIPDANNSAVIKFTIPFFVAAYLFGKYDLLSKFKNVFKQTAFALGTFVIFLILLRFYNFNSFIYTSGFYILDKNILMQLHNDAYRFVVGLFGSVFIMCFVYAFMNILPEIVKKALAYIGTSTLGIYLISNYLFDEVLKRIPVPSLNFWYIVLETICVLVITISLTILLKKNKLTNRLFLGGR